MSAGFDLRPKARPLSDAERGERMKNLGFGRVMSEHMITMRWREGEGWSRGLLEPYGNVTLDPAASVLHYGQAIFEGFKAYAQKDGGIATFRPDANGRRLNASAARLAMPDLPVETFVEASDVLIKQDRAWMPTGAGESIYLRPLMIGTEPGLGVHSSTEYLFVLLASPSGSYFPQGMKPVTVWISEEYVRAAPGGTGSAKFAGNYAASLVAQRDAKQKGCDQVVWIDAVHRKYVEEMGGMNICFVFDGKELVTPSLTGTLLPGVTRDSLLTLARDLGYSASERLISIEDWGKALAEGRMTEAFACGTAAVITPIARVRGKHGEWVVNGGETGPVASRLRQALLDIQHGAAPDPHGWMHRVV